MRQSSEWNGWQLAEDEVFQDIKQRVEEFKVCSGFRPSASSEDSKLEMNILASRDPGLEQYMEDMKMEDEAKEKTVDMEDGVIQPVSRWRSLR